MKESFEEYSKWCVENGKDLLDVQSIAEYKTLCKDKKGKEIGKKKSNRTPELVAKQKEIFQMMCDYCGVKKVKYDDDENRNLFDALDDMFKMVVATVGMQQAKNEFFDMMKRMGIDPDDLD